MTVVQSDVGTAFLQMLGDRVRFQSDKLVQVVKVTQPMTDWQGGTGNINTLDSIHNAIMSFKFSDGRLGRNWFEKRINAMFEPKGEYYMPMRRYGQYDYVISTLRGMKEGKVARWNANRLIINTFDPSKDLHVARAPTPPCLASLAFYPIKDELSLVATFRAQYVDAKAYGNIFSLAMLLRQVCVETGFRPSTLVNIAQKPILHYPLNEARRFYWDLREKRNE